MYFKEENDGYLIYEHDMTNKSLPFDGWFHNCVFCDTISGSTVEFDNKYHLINLLCCKDCKNSNKIDLNRDRIDNWISKNIPKPRRYFFYKLK